MPGNFRGCSRGVFGLKSWEPLRKPGEPMKEPTGSQQPRPGLQQQQQQPLHWQGPSNGAGDVRPRNSPVQQGPSNGAGDVRPRNSPVKQDFEDHGNSDPNAGRIIFSGYTFKANPNSPMGKELNLKQKEELTFLAKVNDHWWLARNENGEEGHIPASYVKFREEPTMSSLPWLQNKAMLEAKAKKENPEPEVKPEDLVYKPYQSTYDKTGNVKSTAAAPTEDYYCKVCGKNLNGPYPYKAHMNSKNHKEMVELYGEDGEN